MDPHRPEILQAESPSGITTNTSVGPDVLSLHRLEIFLLAFSVMLTAANHRFTLQPLRESESEMSQGLVEFKGVCLRTREVGILMRTTEKAEIREHLSESETRMDMDGSVFSMLSVRVVRLLFFI